MTDGTPVHDPVEQRLGLVARGVQRMADAFGSLERRLGDVADKEGLQALSDRMDEYRVRGRSELAHVAERIQRLEATVTASAGDDRTGDLAAAVRALRDDLIAALTDLRAETARAVRAAEAASGGAAGDAEVAGVVRGMRDDLGVAIAELRSETASALERVTDEQATRFARVHDALARTADAPQAAPEIDELRVALHEIRDDLRGVHGEIVSMSSQLRTDLAADAADQRDRLVEALRSTPLGDERLGAIESAIDALRDDLAIERLESSMRTISEDTSGLRNDVRRSFERVLLSIDNAEQSVVGEVRAIDHRLGTMADDLRLVRSMRDGLEALSAGVDAVRQLAARSATSAQMVDLTRDLTQVLAEIEAARAQVLAVDHQVGLARAGAIDVDARGVMRRELEDLERTVSEGINDLGRRIEELASTRLTAGAVTASGDDDAIVRRLRSLATSARQLGLGMAEDFRSRRKRTRPLRAR